MDKYVLSPTELAALRAYIGARSPRFRDPVILLEILDHFACKVEELMAAGIPFPEAMVRAHRSFGVSGFGPIADHVTQGIIAAYRRFVRQQLMQVLRSFHIVGLLAAGLATYQGCLLLRQWGAGDLLLDAYGYGIQLPFLLLSTRLHWKYRRRARQHPVLQQAANGAFQNVGVLFFPVIFPFFHVEKLGLTLFSLIVALMAGILFICLIVQSRLDKKLVADMDIADEQLRSIA